MSAVAAETSSLIGSGWSLICPACRMTTAPAAYPRGCPACAEQGRTSAFVVQYDQVGTLGPEQRTLRGIWKYQGFLPPIDKSLQLSLGEGDTPLVQIPALAELTGNDRIYLKLEMCNPTAAHKDRFHAASIAVGKALGYDRAVSWSTGNHGFSMSSYAAAHGMRAIVVGSMRMPPLIQRAIRFNGGLPLLAPADLCGSVLMRLIDDGWYPSTTSWPLPAANPFGIEGYKTIGFDVYQQLGGRMPDIVCVPAAAGDGVVGFDRAIDDLRRLGLPNTDAQLVPCQPKRANPLVNALDKGLVHVEEIPDAFSLALSIADAISGGFALDAIRRSDGFGVAIEDEEIMAAGRLLAKNGLLVEPSSAASVAGAIQAIRERPELRERSIVCVITSSGLKWLDDYSTEPLEGGVTVDSVDEALRAVDRFYAAPV